MLRNLYLAYWGHLTQLCLGKSEFDNVSQNLVVEFSTVWDRLCKFEQAFRDSERGSKSWQR